MASAYSTPTQYAAPVPTKDINLINQVLAAKQQRFDVNSARIEEAVSQVSNADLLREPEQEKLKERLNGLLNQVAQGSKLDLTDNSTAKMLQSSVASVIDDDLMKHVGIARKTKAFEERLAELEKDDPELYNEANKQYAYYKAGFGEYMNGERDDMDSLKYNPYYDINENLQKDLETYAKNHGYVKTIDQDNNEVFYSQREKTTLTADKIKSFMELRTQQDPKLVRQMQINAYAETGGISDDKLRESFKTKRDTKVKQYNEEKVKKQTLLDNTTNEQRKAELEQEIEVLDNAVRDMNGVDYGDSFNVDNARYNLYKDDMIDNYVKTYAKEDIEKISYDNLSKVVGKAVSKTTGTDTAGQAGQIGIKSTQNLIESGDEVPEMTISSMRNEVETQAATLTSLLSSEDTNFKNGTDEQKTQYIMGLRQSLKENGYDVKAPNGMSPEVYEQVKLLDQAHKRVEEADKVLQESFTPKIQDFYKAIQNAPKDKLKLQNLTKTMPVTGFMLSKGKQMLPPGKNYANLSPQEQEKYLSPEEQKLINNEFALAVANQEGGKTAEYAKEYAANQIKGLDLEKIMPEADAKRLQKSIDENREVQDASFWGGLGKMIWNYGAVAKNWADLAYDYTIGPVEFLNNPKALEKERNKNWAEKDEAWKKTKEGYSEWEKGDTKISQDVFYEDQDLGDLDLDDLAGDKEYEDFFQGSFGSDIDNAIKKQQETSAQNFIEQSALVLNPDREADEDIVTDLDSLVVDQAVQSQVYVPMKNTKYRIIPSDDPSQILVGYHGYHMKNRDEKSELKDTEFIVLPIPTKNFANNPSLRGLGAMATKRAKDWNFSAKNPNEFEEIMPYSIPNSDFDASEFSGTFLNKFGNSLTDKQRKPLITGDLFNSKTDYLKIAQNKGLDAQQMAAYEENVLNQDYSVKYTRIDGSFLVTLQVADKNNPEKKSTVKGYSAEFQDDFDIQVYSMRAAAFVQKYVEDQINQYRR